MIKDPIRPSLEDDAIDYSPTAVIDFVRRKKLRFDAVHFRPFVSDFRVLDSYVRPVRESVVELGRVGGEHGGRVRDFSARARFFIQCNSRREMGFQLQEEWS